MLMIKGQARDEKLGYITFTKNHDFDVYLTFYLHELLQNSEGGLLSKIHCVSNKCRNFAFCNFFLHAGSCIKNYSHLNHSYVEG